MCIVLDFQGLQVLIVTPEDMGGIPPHLQQIEMHGDSRRARAGSILMCKSPLFRVNGCSILFHSEITGTGHHHPPARNTVTTTRTDASRATSGEILEAAAGIIIMSRVPRLVLPHGHPLRQPTFLICNHLLLLICHLRLHLHCSTTTRMRFLGSAPKSRHPRHRLLQSLHPSLCRLLPRHSRPVCMLIHHPRVVCHPSLSLQVRVLSVYLPLMC